MQKKKTFVVLLDRKTKLRICCHEKDRVSVGESERKMREGGERERERERECVCEREIEKVILSLRKIEYVQGLIHEEKEEVDSVIQALDKHENENLLINNIKTGSF